MIQDIAFIVLLFYIFVFSCCFTCSCVRNGFLGTVFGRKEDEEDDEERLRVHLEGMRKRKANKESS